MSSSLPGDLTLGLGRKAIEVTRVTPAPTAHFTLPPDHPFYALVGRVAAEWSQLEHILDLTIWELMGGDKQISACVTAQIMGVGPRCNAIKTLGSARGLSDVLLKPFRTLRGDAYPIADKRARIVHDPWFLEVYTAQPSQFRAMPTSDPRYGIHPVSEEFIGQTLGQIRELQKYAVEAMHAVFDALASSPDKRA